MQLADGLAKYHSDSGYYSVTVPLEASAREILNLLEQYGDDPTEAALSHAKRFLIEVEKWKAGCLQQRMGNAVQNSPSAIWEAFRGAAAAASDIDALLSIMPLRGFGSSVDDETGQR